MKKIEIQRSKVKKPWPTQMAMEQVYEKNLWGTHKDAFYSGVGSHDTRIINPYIKCVIEFLNSFKNPLRVCDLGCGDFNIGKQLVAYTSHYTAVDIVSDLIEHNKQIFKERKLEFKCLDIAIDELPAGDCAIIRQVLQHLSNKEIGNILEKLSIYKYLILTEHIPEKDFVPNIDIISGQGTRLKKNSGVHLGASPFHFTAVKEKLLLSIPSPDSKGIIKTTLYTF